jgi:hypothetical protein
MNKIGHHVMKLHINSQKLHDFIFKRLVLMTNMNGSEGVGMANPKSPGENPTGTNTREKTKLVPFFFMSTLSS